jgi:hypothetical protein
MVTLNGEFGTILIDGDRSNRYIDLPTDVALKFFSGISLQKSRIVDNMLGLYSFVRVRPGQKARFAALRGPKHILQARKNGCVFNPKGKMTMFQTDIPISPVEYDGAQCPDVFWDGCLEAIFGPGNQVKDLTSTPEARAILADVLAKLYTSLGNSTYDVLHYGGHPIIADSRANGWFNVSNEEFADFEDQQGLGVAGLYTTVDALKSQTGLEHFNVEIFTADVDGEKYVGDPIDLFERCINAAPIEMEQLATRNATNNIPLIIKVTKGIFNAYKKYLITEFNAIPESYLLQTTSVDGRTTRVPNVLMYDGHYVVADHDQKLFDTVVGVTTHRCMVLTPGIFGIAHDVESLAGQYDGMGMQIVQKLDPEYKGKFFMTTTFQLGTGIIDPGFMTNASLILTPEI